ncbi:uncharacterized protein LOC105209741 [Zeugodacus cucurbitae]|uniref:uncharacterized protein LOC105209741 n=1 Tax=Zeugodacus cucurbitae TaxID=28588 RepID=UPI0005967E38|nr:uncharacterized protein LOC105209741 [Zeugodacus cucurbitae]
MLRGCSKFTNLSQSIMRNLPLNPTQFKRYIADKCCPSQAADDTADQASAKPAFKNDAFTPPAFMPLTAYRALDDPNEVLGPQCGAHKCKDYKNPEFFAYHRYSFYELQYATLALAKNSEGGVLYEAEPEDECEKECAEDDSAEAEICETTENECKESNADK